MHIKRAWHLLVFIGIFEVLDYLLSPITTFKSTPMAGTPSLVLGINLKVSKFQRFQSSVNFAIFYSVMCISVLCFLHHRHSIWFYYPFCILLLLTPYCGYYCPRGGENLRFLCNFASHHRKTFLQFCKTVSHHCTGHCSVEKWSRIIALGVARLQNGLAPLQNAFAALFHILAVVRGTIARLFRRLDGLLGFLVVRRGVACAVRKHWL